MVSPTPLAAVSLSSLILTWLLCFAVEAYSSSPKATKIGLGYRLMSIEEYGDGALLGILQVKQKSDIYGPDIPLLRLYVK